MSAPAKEAIREALTHALEDSLGASKAHVDELRAALASLDSLVVLTEAEAEKVARQIGTPQGHVDCEVCDLLALLSGSGRPNESDSERSCG